jgi:hypothetical protein
MALLLSSSSNGTQTSFGQRPEQFRILLFGFKCIVTGLLF